MKSAWATSDAEAAVARYARDGIARDLALRVYTTRLLGQNPKLVLHGGGNTSVKTRMTDLNGEEVDVLCVKGSGWDMGTIEPAGLPAVRLEPLKRLRRAQRTVRRGHGARAARQPARSFSAEPVGRNAAARFPAARLRRSHTLDGGAEPHRPAGRREAVRRDLRQAARLRALHHAGFRARQGCGGCVRARPLGRGADPAQARHLHLRGGCARSL